MKQLASEQKTYGGTDKAATNAALYQMSDFKNGKDAMNYLSEHWSEFYYGGVDLNGLLTGLGKRYGKTFDMSKAGDLSFSP
ncbi:TPA: hypothetical protein REU56_002946 [Listeria monocytogenes]|nr:hypothetical protein [Listeria monocytogenes]